MVILLVLAAVLACAVGLVITLSRQPPGWWQPIDLKAQDLAATAQAVENGVSLLITEARQGDSPAARSAPWSMSLDQPSANAWLNTRLAPWAINRGLMTTWPSEIVEIQVNFENGRVDIGALVEASGTRAIISASIEPSVREDGSLWVFAHGVQLGRMPIPAGWLEASATRAAGSPAPTLLSGSLLPGSLSLPSSVRESPAVKSLLRALSGQEALMLKAILNLPDGRAVQVLGLEPKDGKLLIMCRTVER